MPPGRAIGTPSAPGFTASAPCSTEHWIERNRGLTANVECAELVVTDFPSLDYLQTRPFVNAQTSPFFNGNKSGKFASRFCALAAKASPISAG